ENSHLEVFRSKSVNGQRKFYFRDKQGHAVLLNNCPCFNVTKLTKLHIYRVFSLYKRILLLHRFLPIDLRALGDQYVKDEFRRNKTAAPEEVTVFMREWGNYRDTLQTQVLESARDRLKKVEFGAELSEGDLKLFQDEQVGQLYELMLESTKPNRQFDIQEEGLKK
uniref:Succinate dehydrogenase assembly factor 3 n=1 Tax=Oncorhynchus kisutch TaxID=8019 RepID=A0A8C7FM43_ONCKI